MVVRIRFGTGPKLGRVRQRTRRMALAVAGMLTPAAAVATVLAVWRIAADLNWTNSFAISSGLFSHWQVWLGGAILLQLCAHILNRYGRRVDAPASEPGI
ncbi:MAG TPA: hypothetical protein VMA31_09805 [Bryobacteraceae bacterium]|nr:hypothetical protein [Bryobacteraceae bacterium]